MKVRDKTLKVFVDVSRKDCPTYSCYWPRLNPGKAFDVDYLDALKELDEEFSAGKEA
jgi:hypothetical protein